MVKIIYSEIGIEGYGKQKAALGYFAGVPRSTIESLDRLIYDVEMHDTAYVLNEKNLVQEGVIYCGGYLVCREEGCLWATSIGSYYNNIDIFKNDILKITEIIEANNALSKELKQTFNTLIFIGVFAAFERYVVDAATFFVYEDESKLKIYIEKHKDLKESGSDEQRLKAFLKIRGINTDRKTLNDFFSIITDISTIENTVEKYRTIRHNLVHRNGAVRDCTYKYEEILDSMISQLISDVTSFVEKLDMALKPFINKHGIDKDLNA